MRPCRRWARSKRSSGRFRFAAICPSPFRMLPSAAPVSNARHKSPKEGLHMRRTRSQIVSTLAVGLATLAALLLPAAPQIPKGAPPPRKKKKQKPRPPGFAPPPPLPPPPPPGEGEKKKKEK